MKYETSLFTAEFDEENGENIWITDKSTNEGCSLEAAFAGDLGTSPLISKELEEIDDYFWNNFDLDVDEPCPSLINGVIYRNKS